MRALYRSYMGSLSRFIWFVLPVTLVITTAVLVPMKLFDDKGLSRVDKLDLDLKKLKATNRILKRENESLRTQIHAFHSDPEYVEKVARDELGMIGPNEIIYQFPDDSAR